jgi:hypothetical protein
MVQRNEEFRRLSEFKRNMVIAGMLVILVAAGMIASVLLL